MDHDELLRRLDSHLERSNAHMERGNRIMERSNQVMERGNQVMERGSRIMARSNEVMARNEIAFRELRDFLYDQTIALRALTKQINRQTDEVVSELRAQRKALFRMLDRLDGNGGAAGAGAG